MKTRRARHSPGLKSGRARLSLADVRPGCEARIVGLEGLGTLQRERLLSYGVVPGRWVRVIQHAPVTVLTVEHIELAIETDVATGVKVEEVRLDPARWHGPAMHGRGPKRRGRRGGWRWRKPQQDLDPR